MGASEESIQMMNSVFLKENSKERQQTKTNELQDKQINRNKKNSFNLKNSENLEDN